MTIQLNVGIRNMIVDNIAGQLGWGVVEIYSGAQPASADNAATGTLLATIQMNGLAPAVNGVADLNMDATGTAVATGTAGYARWRDTMADALRFDGSVGTSGTDFVVSNTSIVNGDTVTLTHLNLTQPAS